MAINIIHLKCQNCDANLELDMDHLIAFCPYCGQRLLIDIDNLSEILLEKEKTKREEIKYNTEKDINYNHEMEETRRKEIEYDKEAEKTKQQQIKYEHDMERKQMFIEKLSSDKKFSCMFFTFILLAFIFVVCLLGGLLGG